MADASVDVVTPTRNRPTVLEKAVASIARQAFQHYEVFIVDDGSDATHAETYRTIVSRLGPRFHLLQPLRPGELGSSPAVSRNRGINAGTSRYVAFLDDDDFWVWDDHLEAAVDALERTGGELYCADMQGYRGDEIVLHTWFPDVEPLIAGQRIRDEPAIYRTSRQAFVKAAKHRVVHPNMLVVRRQLIERAGGFLASLRYAEDTEFIMRLADHTDSILFCNKVVAKYRLPEGTAHSLTMSRTEQDLQTLAAAQHLRIFARTPEVRHAARTIESWTLRVLSESMIKTDRFGEASKLAMQALVVYPTLGGVRHLGRTLVDRLARQKS